ncbi:MAG TPA: hypothetical protein VMV86_04755 [Methanosarcinales archaeon]|nr:hypothetical protein [Methanosarcinales archaeon]
MKRMTLEKFAERNALIKEGRNKDRYYAAYISDAVKRMKGKPKSQYMSHNTATYRMGS